MKKLKAVVTLVLIGFVVLFAVQNAATVEIDVFTWTLTIPRAVLVFLLLGIGFIVGVLVSSISVLKPKGGD